MPARELYHNTVKIWYKTSLTQLSQGLLVTFTEDEKMKKEKRSCVINWKICLELPTKSTERAALFSMFNK